MPTVDNKPLFMFDNFLDGVYANPGIAFGTIHGTQEEVDSLSAGRRTRNPTPWKPGTTTDRQITVDLGVSKPANFLWLDRGHNYDGEDIKIRYADAIGGAYTTLVTVTVGTDGKDLDDGAWGYVFEGTEVSKQFHRLEFANAGAVDISIPGLWFGQFRQFSSYWEAPVDEKAGFVHKTGVDVSDRGVKSAAVASRLVHTLDVRVGRTDEAASEFTGILEPWQEHLSVGGLTMAVIDWPNNGETLRPYQLQSPAIGAPFRVRGKHEFNLILEEIV